MARQIFLEDLSDEDYRALALRIIERDRLLNRHAIEGAERAQRFLDSIGGILALERMQRTAELFENYERYRRHLELLSTHLPGFSDFIEIIYSEDLDDNDTKAAIRRLARRLWPFLKNKAAHIRLCEVATIRKESPVSLMHNKYFPEAIRAVAREKQDDKRQRMRLRGRKFLKTRKGKIAEKKPSELSSVDLYLWFRKQAYRNACEALIHGGDALDRTKAIKKKTSGGEASYKDAEEFSLDDSWQDNPEEEFSLDDSWLDNSVPEEADYIPEEADPAHDRDLLLILDRAGLTRREKRIIEVSKNFSLSINQTARKLSIAPSTVRVLKHLIFKKSRLVSSS